MIRKCLFKIASILSCYNVNYLVTGGVAEVLMGEKTITFDIDIVIENEPMNIERFKFSLTALQIPVSANDLYLFSENNLLRINVFPYRVDFLPRLDGVDMRACFEDRVMFCLNGLKIPLINMSLLKANKQFSYKSQNR